MSIFSGVEWVQFKEFLPESLRRVAESCGADVAFKLRGDYGGRHLFVPAMPEPEHPLSDLLGPVDCGRLCACYGGETIYVPRGAGLLLRIRNLKIQEMRSQGSGLADIARAVSLTERRVSAILKDFSQVAAG